MRSSGKHCVADSCAEKDFAHRPAIGDALATKGGKPAVVSPGHLDRRFAVTASNVAWVTGIPYLRTYEGWHYLSVVIDLFSRQVGGWSMKPRMIIDLALDALLAADWRRMPQGVVMVHSDKAVSSTKRTGTAF